MTSKNYNKKIKQLKGKDAKLTKYLKHNKPKKRATGKGKNACKICGRHGAHISRYGLHLCRQCFRDNAKSLGFMKFR